jgi:hypothetical protein
MVRYALPASQYPPRTRSTFTHPYTATWHRRIAALIGHVRSYAFPIQNSWTETTPMNTTALPSAILFLPVWFF